MVGLRLSSIPGKFSNLSSPVTLFLSWSGLTRPSRGPLYDRYPRASAWFFYTSSFACPESWSPWYSTYLSIAASSTPTMDTKYPGDQSIFSRGYLSFIHANFFLNWLLVMPFIVPTTGLTAYFGGIIITMCTWSGCILYFTISHPGNSAISFGKSFIRYAFTPGFRTR